VDGRAVNEDLILERLGWVFCDAGDETSQDVIIGNLVFVSLSAWYTRKKEQSSWIGDTIVKIMPHCETSLEKFVSGLAPSALRDSPRDIVRLE
jgi:hypothetical protein